MPSRSLIFDTSALNKLGADKDCRAILAGLGLVYRIGITDTALSEIIATEDEAKRKNLLELLKRLLGIGNCLMPFNWIIEEQAKAYERDADGFDWKRLNVRVKMAEDELTRQEFLHNLSEQTRTEMKQWDKGFRQIFRTAKPAFQNLFFSGQERPSLLEVTEKLMGTGGAHLSIGANLFERATGRRPAEDRTKDFIDRCPPFRALLMALCFTQYDMCIRDPKKESLGKAGRNDMFSAVYLTYCNVFVTNDAGHCKAMTAVADLAGVACAVLSYDEFRAGLVGSI